MPVLIESLSKKSDDFYMGRTDCNKSVIVSKTGPFVSGSGGLNQNRYLEIGDMVNIKINKVNSATLFGEPAESHETHF